MAEQVPSAGTEKSASPGAGDDVSPPLSRYARAAAEGLRASLEEQRRERRESDADRSADRVDDDAESTDAAAGPEESAADDRADAGAKTPPVIDVEPMPRTSGTGPTEARAHERPEKWRDLRLGEPRRPQPVQRGAIVPLAPRPEPEAPGQQERVPFWKRITLPRSTPQDPRGDSIEPILARLASLESQVSTHHSTTLNRLNGFEENITRLWELEDQIALTEVRERLALLEANQQEIADGLHAVARNLSVLAVVLGLSVAAGLLGLGLLL